MQLAAPPADQPSVNRLSLHGRLHLAREILLAYARVRWLVGRRELPELVGTLRAGTRRRSDARSPRRRATPVLPDGARDGLRLAAAVVRTLEALPLDSRCLMRSLVLLTLLERRGTHVELVIAVQPTRRERLSAHAWVELEGRPLLEPGTDDYARLVTL